MHYIVSYVSVLTFQGSCWTNLLRVMGKKIYKLMGQINFHGFESTNKEYEISIS